MTEAELVAITDKAFIVCMGVTFVAISVVMLGLAVIAIITVYREITDPEARDD